MGRDEQGRARDWASLARFDWAKHAKAPASPPQNIRMGNTIEGLLFISSFYFLQLGLTVLSSSVQIATPVSMSDVSTLLMRDT